VINLYYDDGYEESIRIEKANSPKGCVRAHKLSNGDVINVMSILLEFEDNILYEVEEAKGLINPVYERTGRSFTPQQVNEMFK
jgi:hypothetical protein